MLYPDFETSSKHNGNALEVWKGIGYQESTPAPARLGPLKTAFADRDAYLRPFPLVLIVVRQPNRVSLGMVQPIRSETQ